MQKSDLEKTHALYTRVSEIIAKQNEPEMRSVSLEVLADMYIRDQKVCAYCNEFVKWGRMPEVELSYKPYVQAFIEWYEKNVSKTLFTNTWLYDDHEKITGEVGMIVLLRNSNKTAMLDLKTSANVSRSWPVQLAAYKRLCEINGYQPEIYLNIHLKKTTADVVQTDEIYYHDFTHFWEIFSSALKCYNYFNRKEEVTHVRL